MMERGGGDLTTGWRELAEEWGPLGTGYHGLPLLILHQMVPREQSCIMKLKVRFTRPKLL